MTEIKLPKCYKEIDNCEDILRGHCKDYEPHINGFFLSVKQAQLIVKALRLAIHLAETGRIDSVELPDDSNVRDLWDQALEVLTGSEKE